MNFFERMQRTALFGLPYERAGQDPRGYIGLGSPDGPYRLDAPGAVAEVKRALRALAEAERDPFGLGAGAADPVVETTWQAIDDSDVWSRPAAEEFLLAMARYRGLLPAAAVPPGPYVQRGVYPGGPQPTVSGLELIAGAVNTRIGGKAALSRYEKWRGGLLAPPSMVSRPSADTPVTPTPVVSPTTLVPDGASAAGKAAVQAADDALIASWQKALATTNETDRALVAVEMRTGAAGREAAIAQAQASTGAAAAAMAAACVARGGAWDPATLFCKDPGQPPGGPPPSGSSTTALVVLGLVGVGIAVAVYQQRR